MIRVSVVISCVGAFRLQLWTGRVHVQNANLRQLDMDGHPVQIERDASTRPQRVKNT